MKEVDFLFIYEVRSREIESLALLAAQLEHWGYTTAFMNSWRCLDLKYESYDAQVVVISACYDTGTYQFFAGHAGKLKKVVDLQWGQMLKNGYIQSREIVSWDFSGEGLVTRHVCWGPNERKRLEDVYGIEEQYLPICGYLPMDFYRPELADFIIKREQLFTENGLDPNKMTVLFISSFDMVGRPNEYKGKCGHRLQEIIDDSCYESQEIILDWFKRAMVAHKDVQFIYRRHPAEKDNPLLTKMEEEYPNFFCISKEAIKHWIVGCDKIYNWLSTSAAEVYKCGKQSFIIRPVPVPWEADMAIFEGCRAISEYSEFEKSLELACDVPNQPLDLGSLEGYYDIGEPAAYIRISELLKETYESTTYTSNPCDKNTKFTRWWTLAYEWFWLSWMNRVLVWTATHTDWDIWFLNNRRGSVLISRKRDAELRSCRENRCRLNEVGDEELRGMINKAKEILFKEQQ